MRRFCRSWSCDGRLGGGQFAHQGVRLSNFGWIGVPVDGWPDVPATDIASVTAPITTIAAAMPDGIRTRGSVLCCGEVTTSSLAIESNRAACVSASASLTGAEGECG